LGATALVAGVTAIDILAVSAARQHAKVPRPVMYAVTILRPPGEVYAFFRKLEQLPRFMTYLESVQPIDAERSRWVARLPLGGTVAWSARITDDRPGELIAWMSTDDSPLATRGRVTFARAPGRDATEVRVELQLGLPGGEVTSKLARYFARPQIKGDL